MGPLDDENMPVDDGTAQSLDATVAPPPDPALAGSVGELTALVVAQARTRRQQLRSLEAETGISKTTWSAWGRGQRTIARDRLAEVVQRYDPDRAGEWLAAWDRLSAAGDGAGGTASLPDAAARPDVSPVGTGPERRAEPGETTGTARRPTHRRARPLALAATGALVAAGAAALLLPGQGTRAPLAAGRVQAASSLAAPVRAPEEAADLAEAEAPAAAKVAIGSAPVRLLSPVTGARVPPCLVVSGAGRPDAGQTLVVSVRDWGSPASLFRLEPVRFAPGDPSRRWTVQQPLPRGSGAGYEVLVVALPGQVADLERGLGARTGQGWVAPQLPMSARVVAAVRVRPRVDRAGAADGGCPPS
ncbi:hypothetical protein [Kineosporia sp. A_224]|uniref:hypothetical protein n=1 Tax=Kineosporia sp. A_224 TaxID=1962180 RepID=UPI001179A49C|nr:hypothetical protein [Kineosporia sp. A_224]